MNNETLLGSTPFETSDLFLAATLQSLGFPIIGSEWKDNAKCTFYFDSSQKLIQTVESFWRQQLSLEPNHLFSSLKAVKTRLYSDQ